MKSIIGDIRNSKGLTQRQLAEMVGIKYQALQRYENNTVMPSVGIAIKIADALGVETKELFEWDD